MVFTPSLVLILVVGMAADRFDRQKIVGSCYLVLAIAAAALALMSFRDALEPLPILAVLVLVGVARAFLTPTIKVLLVNLVEREHLPRAIALNSTLTKIAVVSGPIAGGLLYAVSPTLALGAVAAIFLVSLVLSLLLRGSTQVRVSSAIKSGDILGGFAAIRRDPTLLGTITLDLFVMYLFGTDLTNWQRQDHVGGKDKRLDAKVSGDDVFSLSLIEDFRTRYVLFEFKNYGVKLKPNVLHVTEKHLFPTAMRATAIILSPLGLHPDSREALRGAMRDAGKLMLDVTSNDLALMLRAKDEGTRRRRPHDRRYRSG